MGNPLLLLLRLRLGFGCLPFSSGRCDWFGWAFRLPFPYFETDGKREEARREERDSQPRCSCSCVVLQRERERGRPRGERGFIRICLFFWGVQVQRPLVWVWGVQPQPLAGVEPLSLPALTKPTTGALVSMRAHPNPPTICPHFFPSLPSSILLPTTSILYPLLSLLAP